MRAIAPESGGFEGIGFTIPSNMAVYVKISVPALDHRTGDTGNLRVIVRKDLVPEGS